MKLADFIFISKVYFYKTKCTTGVIPLVAIGDNSTIDSMKERDKFIKKNC